MDACTVIKNPRFTTQGIYQPSDETPSGLPPGVPGRYNQGKLSVAQQQQLQDQQRLALQRGRQFAWRKRCF